MRIEPFVHFGPMAEQSADKFGWEDFRDGLLENGRVVLLMAMAAMAVSVLLVVAASFLQPATLRWLGVGSALLFGAVHLLVLKRFFSALSVAEGWIYSVAIAAIVFVGVAIVVRIFSIAGSWLPVAMVSAFLLPHTLYELWRLYGNLSAAAPAVWYYTKEAPLQKSTTFLNSIPVQLRLHLNDTAAAERLSFQAPVRMSLGWLLFHAVQGSPESHRPLDLTDAVEQQHGWVFYTNGLAGQRRYLNPDKGLTENRIRRNGIIHAQRLLSTMAAADLAAKASPIQ